MRSFSLTSSFSMTAPSKSVPCHTWIVPTEVSSCQNVDVPGSRTLPAVIKLKALDGFMAVASFFQVGTISVCGIIIIIKVLSK